MRVIRRQKSAGEWGCLTSTYTGITDPLTMENRLALATYSFQIPDNLLVGIDRAEELVFSPDKYNRAERRT